MAVSIEAATARIAFFLPRRAMMRKNFLQIAVLLFGRGPGALHQRGLEPDGALARPIGSTLPGTLVIPRRKTSPRARRYITVPLVQLDTGPGCREVCGEWIVPPDTGRRCCPTLPPILGHSRSALKNEHQGPTSSVRARKR